MAPGGITFLNDLRPRPIRLTGTDLANPQLVLGQGNAPLEVVVATAAREPSLTAICFAWKYRKGGRPVPVHPGQSALGTLQEKGHEIRARRNANACYRIVARTAEGQFSHGLEKSKRLVLAEEFGNIA